MRSGRASSLSTKARPRTDDDADRRHDYDVPMDLDSSITEFGDWAITGFGGRACRNPGQSVRGSAYWSVIGSLYAGTSIL